MRLNLKYIILVVILVVILSYSSFACVEVESGMQIKEDTILCSNTYEIDQSIKLHSNVVFNCGGAVIDGLNSNDIIEIADKENIVIENCIFRNVQRGVQAVGSSNIKILNNEFNSIGGAGIVISDTTNSVISGNTFKDSESGIYLQEFYNISFENESANTFINISDMDINKGKEKELVLKNNYKEDHVVDAIVRDKISFEPVDPEPEPVVEPEPIVVPVPEPVNEEPKELIIEYEYNKYERSHNILDDILNNDREINGYFGVGSVEELDRLQRETAKITKVTKTVCINDNKAEITTRIYIKKDIEPLVIYEHIPKNLAVDISELEFDTPPYRIIKVDPLIMWYYPKAKAGETIETSYKIKDVDSYEDFESYDRDKSTREQCNTKVCDDLNEPSTLIFEVEEPLSIVVGKESKGALRVLYLLFPIALIPVIIFVFIYTPRRKK